MIRTGPAVPLILRIAWARGTKEGTGTKYPVVTVAVTRLDCSYPNEAVYAAPSAVTHRHSILVPPLWPVHVFLDPLIFFFEGHFGHYIPLYSGIFENIDPH